MTQWPIGCVYWQTVGNLVLMQMLEFLEPEFGTYLFYIFIINASRIHNCTTTYTLCLKKGYHPNTNDNFNNSCPIPVIFGTNITE